jgi:predicted site-specific integrase-resolvase
MCEQTIRKLADDKKVISYRTPTGFRRFDKQCLLQMFGNVVCIQKDSSSNRPINKKNYIYTRVSSRKQSDDLQRQISFITSRVNEAEYDLIQDIGSGVNFKRKGFQTILDSCLQGVIGTIIIAHKDRLCRFGYELIESVVLKSGGKIQVIDQDIYKSPEQELSEDLLSIIHIFSCRQMGRRKYKKEIKQTKESQTN